MPPFRQGKRVEGENFLCVFYETILNLYDGAFFVLFPMMPNVYVFSSRLN